MSTDRTDNQREHLQADLAVSRLHHRIRNTFQYLISYIGIMYGDRSSISRSELDKLIRFVHSLSATYEFGLEKIAGQDLNIDQIRLDNVIKMVSRLNPSGGTIELGEIPMLYGTYRQAVSLSLILNELLDNATRYGAGLTSLGITKSTSGEICLNVVNNLTDNDQSVRAIVQGTGLHLVTLMAKADLDSVPTINCQRGQFEVLVPLSQSMLQSNEEL